MRHTLIVVLTVLASALCVVISACWVASYNVLVNVVWTSGTTHNQLISYNGAIYFVQNYDWWRKESLGVHIDRDPIDAPIATWPGMLIDSQNNTVGTTISTGQWVSPFIQITNDTAFTSPGLSIKPGTMYSSTTRMKVRGVDYWLLNLVPVSWLIILLIRKLQTGRRQQMTVVQQASNAESDVTTAS